MNKQKIEIYADFGTIPSLNFFLHFLENAEDKETIRLFGLQRFSIPDSIINAYPKGIIHFCKMSELDMQAFQQRFLELVSVKDKHFEIVIHTNLSHNFSIVQPLFNILSSLHISLDNVHLHLYDDGAEGVVNLYRLAKDSSKINTLNDFLKQDNYKALLYVAQDWDFCLIYRYFWNRLLKTTYHLLNPDILDKYEGLSLIKNEIKDVRKINLEQIQYLSDEKKERFLEILQIEKSALNKLADLSRRSKIVLFLGTTVFASEQDKQRKHQLLEALHTAILNYYIKHQQTIYPPADYVFCFKGHPHAVEMNQRLRQTFANQVGFLPDHLPLEVLLFWGFKPIYVTGFAGTSHFYFDKQMNSHLYFITEDHIGHLADEFTYQQHRLFKEMMLELDYLEQGNAHSHTEFYAQ